MPRRLRLCVCNCGLMTRGEFAVGHHGSYRQTLLRIAASSEVGRDAALNELTIRGWLPEQGYWNLGTQPGAEGRTENRQLRRVHQATARRELARMRLPGSMLNRAIRPPGNIPVLRRGLRQPAYPAIAHTVAPTALFPIFDLVADPYARRFGVEIEYVGTTRDRIVTEMQERGIDCRPMSYNHDVVSWWKIVGDASLRTGNYDGDETHTGECVSPPLQGEGGIEQLRLAFEALVAAGAKVNRTCGLHVHHEVADYQMPHFRTAIHAYSAGQSLINQIMPRSRRSDENYSGSSYAQAFHQGNLDDLDRAPSLQRFAHSMSRFSVLNVQSFALYGTLEFRQHAGTVNFRKAHAWIRFGQRLLHFALTRNRSEISTESWVDFLLSLGCERLDVRYLVRRATVLTDAATSRLTRREGRRLLRRQASSEGASEASTATVMR